MSKVDLVFNKNMKYIGEGFPINSETFIITPKNGMSYEIDLNEVDCHMNNLTNMCEPINYYRLNSNG